jgi:hypothetical protein
MAGDGLPDNAVLTDRRGVDWRKHPDWQESDKDAPGWYLLRSSLGEELSAPEAIKRYGTFGGAPATPFESVKLVFLMRLE